MHITKAALSLLFLVANSFGRMVTSVESPRKHSISTFKFHIWFITHRRKG